MWSSADIRKRFFRSYNISPPPWTTPSWQPDQVQRCVDAMRESAENDVESAIRVGAFGGFLVSQQAAKRMIPNAHGAILLTGASASVKGYAQSAPFAMSKFALRGLAQSMARELGPLGIHVAHFVIDGAVRQGDAPGVTRMHWIPGVLAAAVCALLRV